MEYLFVGASHFSGTIGSSTGGGEVTVGGMTESSSSFNSIGWDGGGRGGGGTEYLLLVACGLSGIIGPSSEAGEVTAGETVDSFPSCGSTGGGRGGGGMEYLLGGVRVPGFSVTVGSSVGGGAIGAGETVVSLVVCGAGGVGGGSDEGEDDSADFKFGIKGGEAARVLLLIDGLTGRVGGGGDLAGGGVDGAVTYVSPIVASLALALTLFAFAATIDARAAFKSAGGVGLSLLLSLFLSLPFSIPASPFGVSSTGFFPPLDDSMEPLFFCPFGVPGVPGEPGGENCNVASSALAISETEFLRSGGSSLVVSLFGGLDPVAAAAPCTSAVLSRGVLIEEEEAERSCVLRLCWSAAGFGLTAGGGEVGLRPLLRCDFCAGDAGMKELIVLFRLIDVVVEPFGVMDEEEEGSVALLTCAESTAAEVDCRRTGATCSFLAVAEGGVGRGGGGGGGGGGGDGSKPDSAFFPSPPSSITLIS